MAKKHVFKIEVVPAGKKKPVLLDYEIPRHSCRAGCLDAADHPELLKTDEALVWAKEQIQTRFSVGHFRPGKYDVLITEGTTKKTHKFPVTVARSR